MRTLVRTAAAASLHFLLYARRDGARRTERPSSVVHVYISHHITVDFSERDNKETLLVKEEETNDAEVFGEVVVEMARLLKEPKSSVVV